MDQTIIAAAVVAIIVICQFAKSLSFMNKRAIPVLAIVLGIISAFVINGAAWIQIAGGIIMGLSSMGLYSGFKSTVLNK